MLAAQDKENGPEEYLEDIAIRHDAKHLDVAPTSTRSGWNAFFKQSRKRTPITPWKLKRLGES